MRNLIAIVLGLILAACAAKQSRMHAAPTASVAESMPSGPSGPRGELDQLDAQITADMEALGVARPAPPPMTCTGDTCGEQMSTTAAAAVASDPQCRPANTDKCTQSCTLKDSICKNASRICELAAKLGGTDAYANEKCASGNASCEAAKQRCCGCM